MSTTPVVPLALLEQVLRVGEGALIPLDEAKRVFERDFLVRLLKMTGGNVSQSAKLSGRNRTEFYKILQRHGISPAMFKNSRDE